MHDTEGTERSGGGRLEELIRSLVELEEERTLELVAELMADGVSSLALIHASEQAMRVIGERYERQEYYLSGLILAGEILREVVELARPGLREEFAGEASGRILLGTVAGDIHDIGKNIVGTALTGFGFTVRDLGVDVPPERFLETAREFGPDIVGLSGLVAASYESMRETVQLLRAHEAELGRLPAIVLGGGTIDEHVRSYVQADSWTTDAIEGVRICQQLSKGGSRP